MKTPPIPIRFLPSAILGAALLFGMTESSQAALIAHFRFDEGIGTTAANLADPTSPGVFSASGATWTTDVPENFLVSSAYHNTGIDGASVSVRSDAPAFTSIGDITVSGWIDATSVVGTTGAYDRIVSKRQTSGNPQTFDIGFRNSGSGVGISVSFGTTIEVITAPLDFSAGWLFFAVSRESDTGAISIYIGSTDPLEDLELKRSGSSEAGVFSNTAPLMIGNTPAGTGTRAGVVSYSDFRFYDEALDMSAIEAIRLSNLQAIPEPGTVGLALSATALAWVATRSRRRISERPVAKATGF